MGVQVSIAASCIDKQRLGYCGVSLTHFSDTAEPSIASGSKIEIGGALYEFLADEAGTGWAGIGVSTWAYILLTPSGATVSWSYTTTAPTWDTAKQGWYTGLNRVIGGLYKSAGSAYTLKWLYRRGPTGVQAFKEYGDGTIEFTGAVSLPGGISGEVTAGGLITGNITTANGLIETGIGGVTLKRKVLAMGDWNMDSTTHIHVAHGLTLAKIRGAWGMIRNDADTIYNPVPNIYADHSDFDIYADCGIATISATDVDIFRRDLSHFDSINYDSLTYNRGWVTIEYEA